MSSLQSLRNRLQSQQEVTLLGLGDSLTQGWMVKQGFFDRFINQLKRKYPRCTIHSHNHGVPGSTAQEAIERLYRVDEIQPDGVIVQFALNDCFVGVPVGNYSRHLENIATALIQQGIGVILVTSCPVEDEGFGSQVMDFYKAIEILAKRMNIDAIRLHDYWLNRAAFCKQPLLQADGVHPTDAGHELMAKGLLAAF